MIDKRELRIGNYIQDEFGDIRKVVAIAKNCVGFEYDVIEIYEECKPIPLTEEWLLKLGLQPSRKTEYYNHYAIPGKKYGFAFCIKSFQDHRTKGEICLPQTDSILNYVHQLQNLYFALTGQELQLTQQQP